MRTVSSATCGAHCHRQPAHAPRANYKSQRTQSWEGGPGDNHKEGALWRESRVTKGIEGSCS